MRRTITPGWAVLRGVVSCLALAGGVICLVWLNRVAGAVMEIGGSCASGGPYVVARPCPEGTWMAFAGVFGGFALFGVYALSRAPGGPQFVVFTWPAVFLSLGIQFLRQDTGGGTVTGVLFVLMGGVPLLVALWSAPQALLAALIGRPAQYAQAADPTGVGLGRPDVPRRVTRFRRIDHVPVRRATVGTVVVATPAPPPERSEAEDLAEALERITALHRDGALSDDEFAAAKRRLLEGS